MRQNPRTEHSRACWVAAMLRDPQFWVPLAVLVGGLILLGAVQ